jgi:serine/threonine protein kinase
MATQSTNVAPQSDDIAGYKVVRQLGESSYLCLAPGERCVVLKPLDPDCLIKGQLHPSIKERLARIRELAHGGVANLYGVERTDETAWLVWEYVEAPTLEEFFRSQPSVREAARVARELAVAIEALHARGIVHGAIHERNVLLERSRAVRLTHVSPLLYTEPADDESALLDLLERAAQGPHQRLADLAREARPQPQPVRWLRGRVAELIEERPSTIVALPEERVQSEPPSGRATLIAAALLTLGGVAMAYGVVRWVERDVGNASHSTAR